MQRSGSPADDAPAATLSHLYALRLWRTDHGAPWRAALRPADGGAPRRFADLEELAMFLLDLADGQAPPDDGSVAKPVVQRS